MRAIVVETFGDPGVLRMVDLPIPEPGAGAVRIRVAAAGINPVDTYNVKDPTWAGIDPGCVLGYDLSGTVDAVGSGVDQALLGQQVMAMTPFPRGQGAYAEYAVVPAPLVATLTGDVDLVAAASVPLAAGTAWEVLKKLESAGPSMLVIGGERRGRALPSPAGSSTRYQRHCHRSGAEPRRDARTRCGRLRRLPVARRHRRQPSSWPAARSTRSPSWSGVR